MKMTNEQLATLCGVAGWKDYSCSTQNGVFDDGGSDSLLSHSFRVPRESRDDAHKLLSAVVAKLGADARDYRQRLIVAAAERETKAGMPFWEAAEAMILISSESLCAAMFAFLPECPSCDGDGKLSIGGTVCGKCGNCGGSGKAVPRG